MLTNVRFERIFQTKSIENMDETDEKTIRLLTSNNENFSQLLYSFLTFKSSMDASLHIHHCTV